MKNLKKHIYKKLKNKMDWIKKENNFEISI